MKFLSVLAILALFTTGTLSAEEVPIKRAQVEEVAGSANISKRACEYDTDCKGYGWSSALHCGDGNYGCVKGHVYQIGSDPTNVCDFGPRTSCQQCGKLTC